MQLSLKKVLAVFACLAIIGAMGLFFEPTCVCAGSSEKSDRDSEIQNQDAMVIVQNEPDQSSEKESGDRSAGEEDPDAENQDSDITSEKKFSPSLQIDADYPVSFPYDI